MEPDATVPDDVRHILVSKLDDLGGAVRRTVQTASVLGREVDLRVLERMTHGATDVDLDVAEGIEAHVGIGYDGERVAFRNLLVKDAAYGMLLHSELRMLHEEAAHAIESFRGTDEEAAAELAYHYERAGKAEVAAQHHLVAGRVAAGRYASDEALTHLHRVLDLLRPSEPERRLEALRLVHGIHDMLGDRAAQEEDLRTMSAIAGDSAESAVEINLLRARLLTSLGSYHDAEQIAAEVSAVAERHDLRPSLGSLLFLRAQLARYVGRTDAAQAHAAEARRIFVETGDRLQVASVDDFSGGMAWDRGDFVAAAELHRSAAEVFHEAGRATDEIRALNNLGSAIFAMGDYATAREIHEAGAAAAERSAIGWAKGTTSTTSGARRGLSGISTSLSTGTRRRSSFGNE